MLALTTGMRQGELLGLRWADIDFERRLVQVRHTVVRVRGAFQLAEPKTTKSRRSVLLSRLAAVALRRHWIHEAQRLLVLRQKPAGIRWSLATAGVTPPRPSYHRTPTAKADPYCGHPADPLS